jgi:hypothetical protein
MESIRIWGLCRVAPLAGIMVDNREFWVSGAECTSQFLFGGLGPSLEEQMYSLGCLLQLLAALPSRCIM